MTDEQMQLQKEINDELNKLSNIMSSVKGNENLLDNKLRGHLSFLKWVNLNWKLRSKSSPRVIKQKEIFFCQLGENIGSEQNGKRPVIIIQNDIGNSMGNTTIIIPITTYENSNFYTKDNKRYMSYTLPNGITKERKLDFYEVPIQIEKNPKYPIHGIANVVHMREVSKKRLSNTPVATITEQTYNDIVNAINKNISIF